MYEGYIFIFMRDIFMRDIFMRTLSITQSLRDSFIGRGGAR